MTAISALQAVARLASKEVQALPQVTEVSSGAASKLAGEVLGSPLFLRARQVIDATFNTGAVKQIDDIGLRNAADLFPKVNSLREQLAASPLRVNSSKVFGNFQGPEAVPHYVRALPKNTNPVAGDIVGSDRFSKSTFGILQKFVTDPEGKKIAILELQAAKAAEPAKSFSELQQINSRFWKNDEGLVYTARRGVDDPQSLQHMVAQPAMRAADADTLKVLQMQRPLPPEAQREISDNNFIIDLVAKSYNFGFSFRSADQVRQLILGKLSNAPEHYFTNSPFLSWRANTIFNPNGAAHNCMGCTAAVFRTLGRTGLTTADDVAKLANKQKVVIGDPAPGRFKNEVDAMDWFSKAAGAKFTGVAENINTAAPGNYAAIMRIDNNVWHMIFAHKPNSGAGFFYDAQSGVRLNNKSVTDWKRGVVFNRMDIVKSPEYF